MLTFIQSFLIFMILSKNVESIQFSMEGPKNSDTYGPYVLGFNNFGSCPHSENNLANLSIALVCEQNAYKGTINVTLDKPVRIVEIKVVIHSIKNNRKSLLWDYVIEKPCLNRVVSAALKPHVDIRTCVMRKGVHTVTLNYSETVYLFFGSSFFYGEYLAKFTVLSTRKQVMLCILADELVNKKPPPGTNTCPTR